MELKQKTDLPIGCQLIRCGELLVFAACEIPIDKKEIEVEMYYPAIFLIYVEEGVLRITTEQNIYIFPRGSLCLVRKFTKATYAKILGENETRASTISIGMPSEFIRRIISDIKFEKNVDPIGERILPLDRTSSLMKIIDMVKKYMDRPQCNSNYNMEVLVEETLKAILTSSPDLKIIFKEFSLAERADMDDFMNVNFLLKVPLEELAVLSGRSLSTFTREFKLIYNTTPKQWILKKRLNFAYRLLKETNQKLIDVHQEFGFEDLPHFSKSFKKEFGFNPSELKKWEQ